MKILVTGGSGFVGNKILARILRRGDAASALVRAKRPELDASVLQIAGDMTALGDLGVAVEGIDVIFHLAGYAHAWAEKDDDGVHHKVTVEGTRNLLRAAGEAGVKRFIFFSSVKAGSEGTTKQDDEHADEMPTTPYGRAKREAEALVLAAGKKYGMHVCNLRLSMVYGVGMKGNLPRMIEAVDRGRFPPLPNVNNKRSMVWVDDVVQAALLAAEKPQANGQTYIVTDDEAYSTRRIYEAICRALNKPVPRWAVPMMGLQVAAKIGDVIGALRRRRFPFDSEALDKLLGSAHYSSAKISRELGYRPTKKLEAVLPEIIAAMRAHDLVRR